MTRCRLHSRGRRLKSKRGDSSKTRNCDVTPLGLGFGLGFGLGLGLGLKLGLRQALGLGSSRDDLDDHFRRLQPTDLNLDLPTQTTRVGWPKSDFSPLG